MKQVKSYLSTSIKVAWLVYQAFIVIRYFIEVSDKSPVTS